MLPPRAATGFSLTGRLALTAANFVPSRSSALLYEFSFLCRAFLRFCSSTVWSAGAWRLPTVFFVFFFFFFFFCHVQP
jgi:hypothetical protein